MNLGDAGERAGDTPEDWSAGSGGTESAGDAARAPRRADARRNHERVLAAAIEVFTEQGLDATIPEVASRAGVGKATVYRSYPTKADLIEALAQVHLDWIDGLVAAEAGQAEVDARAALCSLLDQMVTRMASDRLMVAVLEDRGFDCEQPANDLERILECGRAQGAFRPDVSALDVRVLLSGVAGTLISLGVRDVATWRRYAALILTALRP